MNKYVSVLFSGTVAAVYFGSDNLMGNSPKRFLLGTLRRYVSDTRPFAPKEQISSEPTIDVQRAMLVSGKGIQIHFHLLYMGKLLKNPKPESFLLAV